MENVTVYLSARFTMIEGQRCSGLTKIMDVVSNLQTKPTQNNYEGCRRFLNGIVCGSCEVRALKQSQRPPLFFVVIMAPKDSPVSGDIEGDWVDGKVASLPTTTTGCLVQWQVYTEMRHWAEQWADLPFEDNCRVEASFMTDKESVTIGTSPDTWTFDVVRLIQRNEKTGRRGLSGERSS